MFAIMFKRIAVEKPRKDFPINTAAVQPMNKILAVTLPNLVVATGWVAAQVGADVETHLYQTVIAVRKEKHAV